MPPKRPTTYGSRCPPAHFMMSACDRAARPLINPADGQSMPLISDECSTAATTTTTITGRGVVSKNHCCRLLQGLQELRYNSTLCDYSVIAEGEVSFFDNYVYRRYDTFVLLKHK